MLAELGRFGLEYAEQPCATLAEMAELRRLTEVPLAADESIRRAEDPLGVRAAGAADIVVLKVQPLGGVAAALRVAEACGLPVVVSSAVDTSVGLAAGVALAAALPELPYACGLGHDEPADGGRDRRAAGPGRGRAAGATACRLGGGAGPVGGGPRAVAGPGGRRGEVPGRGGAREPGPPATDLTGT